DQGRSLEELLEEWRSDDRPDELSGARTVGGCYRQSGQTVEDIAEDNRNDCTPEEGRQLEIPGFLFVAVQIEHEHAVDNRRYHRSDNAQCQGHRVWYFEDQNERGAHQQTPEEGKPPKCCEDNQQVPALTSLY